MHYKVEDSDGEPDAVFESVYRLSEDESEDESDSESLDE
jgi:hypothetical protein